MIGYEWRLSRERRCGPAICKEWYKKMVCQKNPCVVVVYGHCNDRSVKNISRNKFGKVVDVNGNWYRVMVMGDLNE